jgi:hypothetical protein
MNLLRFQDGLRVQLACSSTVRLGQARLSDVLGDGAARTSERHHMPQRISCQEKREFFCLLCDTERN